MAGELGARILKTRWIVRAPIGLFRAGLGFLFAGKMLLLEHIGRASGKPRYVVLETVVRRGRNEIVVASGFGENAQWFRNIRANPECHISIGARRRSPGLATILGQKDADAVLAEYRSAHPKAWAELESAIIAATGETDPQIPFVSLRLI